MKKVLRARSGPAREVRRIAILKAASELVDHQGFPALTMDLVAKRCKLAKATLYGYFQTREELLLTILQQDFKTWFSAFRSYLEASDAPFSDEFVAVWISAIQNQPRLATGLMFVYTQLEANIGFEFAQKWKRFLFNELKESHYALMSRFQPTISFQLLGDFFVTLTGVSLGLWAQSQTNDTILAVFKKEPELEILLGKFDKHMQVAMSGVLLSPTYALLRKVKANG